MDWPLALSSVLDAAALYAAFVDGEHTGAARLLHRDGCRMAAMLLRQFAEDDSAEPAPSDAELAAALERLHEAGFPLNDQTAARTAFAELRRGYAGRVAALAAHFGLEPPRLVA